MVTSRPVFIGLSTVQPRLTAAVTLSEFWVVNSAVALAYVATRNTCGSPRAGAVVVGLGLRRVVVVGAMVVPGGSVMSTIVVSVGNDALVGVSG